MAFFFVLIKRVLAMQNNLQMLQTTQTLDDGPKHYISGLSTPDLLTGIWEI